MNNKSSSSPVKVNTATIIAVLALHMGVAAALVALDTPKPMPKKPEIEKPIEIELLTLAEQPEVLEVAPQPVVTPPPQQPVSKPEPPKPAPVKKVEPKPEPAKVTKPEPKPEPKPVEKIKTQPEPKIEKTPIVKPDPKPVIDNTEQQRLIDKAAAERAAAERAAAERAAAERAAAERAAAEKAAAEKAAAEKAAAEKAAAEKAAAAASNIPQNFSANQASWRSKPNFSIPPAVVRRLNPGDRLRVMVRLTVDKSGTVTSATLAKSSGNTALDNYTVNTAKKVNLILSLKAVSLWSGW